jgi:hypothetical protein
VQTGEVVLSTDAAVPIGTTGKAGDTITLGARATLVIQST